MLTPSIGLMATVSVFLRAALTLWFLNLSSLVYQTGRPALLIQSPFAPPYLAAE